MTWGIAMAPCVDTIKDILSSLPAPVHYLELGIASGETLAGVGHHLFKVAPGSTLTGVDIKDGWSLNMADIERNLGGLEAGIHLNGSQEFLAGTDRLYDFILIDACHALACVMADFRAASERLRPGGYICFHDSDADCQGQDVQPHCGQPIQVRQALAELGLLDGSNGEWEKVVDLPGSSEGRGCVVVRKR